jgi:predicted kinase
MKLYVTFGIPGSGKSTWASRHAAREHALLATTDPTRTERTNIVQHLAAMGEEINDALSQGTTVIVDACNIDTALRRRWLRIGLQHEATCILAVMATSHHTSIANNRARPAAQQVPAQRMQTYVENYSKALATAHNEPWHQLLQVAQPQGRQW